MLTLLTTDDFAEWFGVLPDEDAEDVAATLGVIEALGPARMAPGSSELLLWYQSPPSNLPPWIRHIENFGELTDRLRRIMRHLESEPLLQRLAEVSTERASVAHQAVRALVLRARWRRLYAERDGKLAADVQRHYHSLLEALELEEPKDDEAPQASLRQIDICKRTPGLRVLYGVDPAHQRALVVLGEALDRRAYGASVRKAVSVWREFLRGERAVVPGASVVRSSR